MLGLIHRILVGIRGVKEGIGKYCKIKLPSKWVDLFHELFNVNAFNHHTY